MQHPVVWAFSKYCETSPNLVDSSSEGIVRYGLSPVLCWQAALGDDAEFLAEKIFTVFDNDGSGSMDFQEYVMALNSTKCVRGYYRKLLNFN